MTPGNRKTLAEANNVRSFQKAGKLTNLPKLNYYQEPEVAADNTATVPGQSYKQFMYRTPTGIVGTAYNEQPGPEFTETKTDYSPEREDKRWRQEHPYASTASDALLTVAAAPKMMANPFNPWEWGSYKKDLENSGFWEGLGKTAMGGAELAEMYARGELLGAGFKGLRYGTNKLIDAGIKGVSRVKPAINIMPAVDDAVSAGFAESGLGKSAVMNYPKPPPQKLLPPPSTYVKDPAVNELANHFRRQGVNDAFPLAEELWPSVTSNVSIPSKVYRGLRFPLNEEGKASKWIQDAIKKKQSTLSARVVSPKGEHYDFSNKGALWLNEKLAPVIEGKTAATAYGNNYYTTTPFVSRTPKVAQAYAHVPFSATGRQKLYFPEKWEVNPWDVKHPTGAMATYEVAPNVSKYGLMAEGDAKNVIASRLGKPVEKLTMGDTEQFMKNVGLDWTYTPGRFEDAIQFVPGKLQLKGTEWLYKSGGKI